MWQGDAWVDASHASMRGIAWTIVECARVTRPSWIVVENVPNFELWDLYPTWRAALRELGYSISESFLSSELFGVPQLRKRMFVIASLGEHIVMKEPDTLMRPAFETCIDWGAGEWKSIYEARTERSRTRLVEASRKYTRALVQASTSHHGLPVFEPIRTITAQDHWAVVDGQRYRSLLLREIARGMGFPDSYAWPDATRLEVIKGFGNAVCPPVARALIEHVLRPSVTSDSALTARTASH
jgi:DNA (cytosine-5)-methyltransferase 1